MYQAILHELRAIATHRRLQDNSLAFAFLSSLGLHGVLACFLMPSSLVQSPENEINTVEIIWDERIDQPSTVQNQVNLFKAPKPFLKKIKRKVAQTSQSSLLLQKVKFNSYNDKNDHTTARAPYQRQASERILKQEEQEMRATTFTAHQVSPRQSYCPLPQYPWVCRKRNQQGTVAIKVKTNAEGKVVHAILHKSSGHTRLDEVAIEALQTWVFAEGLLEKTLSIVFRLKKEHP
ncbi:MAG: energy transducer TonB [Alphaproteobacteria bacterium]|nr:energy transducer TonB [Alphaproteobacteria bacterium]